MTTATATRQTVKHAPHEVAPEWRDRLLENLVAESIKVRTGNVEPRLDLVLRLRSAVRAGNHRIDARALARAMVERAGQA